VDDGGCVSDIRHRLLWGGQFPAILPAVHLDSSPEMRR
jgi:hypothetical protein